MDELKLFIGSELAKGLIGKILAKAIRSKTGYEVEINLDNLRAETKDGKLVLDLRGSAVIDESEFMRAVKLYAE